MFIQFRSWFKGIFLVLALVQLTGCATNFRQGLQHLEDHNYPEALEFFEKDAQRGDRIPAIHAANLYIIDYQVPRDLEKSRYYLELALNADYGLYDQAYDYYIPLIKAYQILADESLEDKSTAINMLNYQKYHHHTWALNTLGLCHLVGYGTRLDLEQAKLYFERAINSRLNDDSNAIFAWWLAVYPDPTFRNPQRALALISSSIDDDELKVRPSFQDTLAAVYASNDQFSKALEAQQLAIILLKEKIKKYDYMSVYLPGFESRLDSYKQEKPWVYTQDDIKRCGFDSKRCLRMTAGEFSIEKDKLSEELLIHHSKSRSETLNPNTSDFHY